MSITNLTVSQGHDQFYPTPPSVAKKMLEGIKWDMIETVLEPSAGKGDLILAAAEARYDYDRWHRDSLDVDAVEIDPNLRAICKYNFSEEKTSQYDYQSREYGVLSKIDLHMVHDDFLTYSTYKKYDLILMNPPFEDGDLHLLKALDMQKNGGSIVCLLNAETIRNPYTERRSRLKKKLDELNADIQFIEDAFSTDAERKARVDVAVIKAYIPPVVHESSYFDRMKKAVDEEYIPDQELNALIPANSIDQYVCLYKAEVAATMELIKEYKALLPYINTTLNEDDRYKQPILSLIVNSNSSYKELDIKKYMKMVRLKYWRAFFKNDEFTGKLTSNLREQFSAQVEKMADYEFSAFNIKQILVEMNAAMQQGVHDTILNLFEKLTVEHSWYPECANNRHYYNGWKTNQAHKVGKKCIIPENGIFSSYSWSKETFDVYNAYKVLSDLEKAFNYLDGGHFEGSRYNLESFLNHANDNHQTRNIDCTYFKVDLYKKGTVHIKFRPEAMPLVERLNIFAAQNKKWLPPRTYKVKYSDLTKEEKEVIDSFQGEEAYNEVMNNKDYYLSSFDTKPLLIAGGN